MDVTQSRRPTRGGRLLLLALFAAIAWTVLTLFASVSSSSASEGDDPGSGLLGAVGNTLDAATSAVAETTGAVDQLVTEVTTAVTPAVQPVVSPLPAPVAQPVAEVVTTVTETAQTAVAHVDTAAVDAVDTATSTVTGVAGAEVVSTVVKPVVELVESAPVAGAVVETIGLGDGLNQVAAGVDGTLSTVVGSAPPVGSILPELPLTAVTDAATVIGGAGADGVDPPAWGVLPVLPFLPSPHQASRVAGTTVAMPSAAPGPPDALRARAGAPVAISGPSTPLRGLSWPADSAVQGHVDSAPFGPGLPIGSAVAGGPASATSAGAGSALAGLAHEDPHGPLYGFSTLRTTIDDALPGAPVFDTDVSPD
jgi:hypothetical protein